jgi:hypothetical protein
MQRPHLLLLLCAMQVRRPALPRSPSVTADASDGHPLGPVQKTPRTAEPARFRTGVGSTTALAPQTGQSFNVNGRPRLPRDTQGLLELRVCAAADGAWGDVDHAWCAQPQQVAPGAEFARADGAGPGTARQAARVCACTEPQAPCSVLCWEPRPITDGEGRTTKRGQLFAQSRPSLVARARQLTDVGQR